MITKFLYIAEVVNILKSIYFNGCYEDEYDTLRYVFADCAVKLVKLPVEFFAQVGDSGFQCYYAIWNGIILLLGNDNPAIREILS